VWEWNEQIVSGSFRGVRGGSWGDFPSDLAASHPIFTNPTSEFDSVGFRVASLVPEPGTQCDDGLDNDGDGLVDNDDPGCAVSGGESELPRNDVRIDVVPFSLHNKVLPKPHWIISVAVLAADTVDVNLVDRDSLAFGPEGAASIFEFPLDVYRDRDRDLVTMYYYMDTALPLGQSEACLTGLIDGVPFEACDSVNVNVQVSCGLGFELALLLPPLMWLHRRRMRSAT